MRQALLFRENEDPILVSAEDVKNGLYDRNEEFVDPEYEFKVQFVRGARNNGAAYFRLYYSYEEYKKLFPQRASRYEIVANMRKYAETEWHRRWKLNMAGFCEIEKVVKSPSTKKIKFADAFYDKAKMCIEFQHSYIALDFEERNAFYNAIGIRTVWLYDLPSANVRQDEQGNFEILEDNAKGFFRISEKPENLKKHYVYIQVKSGMIYRVTELLRREICGEQKSTIRYFVPKEIYTEAEFIDAIREQRISSDNEKGTPKPLNSLWNRNYMWMSVKNVESGEVICINRDHAGEMYRDFKDGLIRYVYVDRKYGQNSSKEYCLSRQKENRSIWLLVASKEKS